MKPIFCQIGVFTIYSYGLFVALAFLASTFLLMRQARMRHLNENNIYNFCIVLLISGIVSARIFYIGFNWDFFKGNIAEMFMLSHGGLVWFGGLTGAMATGFIFMKIKKMPFFGTLDLFAPYVALGQAIGRIGCFFNGCCFGKESHSGIYSKIHEAVLFPSQLLDSLMLLIVFLVLRKVSFLRPGKVFALYLVLASLERFLIEFFRGDARPFYGPLSIFQWISIIFFTAGLLFFSIPWKKKVIQ